MLNTVYSLYYPETAGVVDALWRRSPHEMYQRAWELPGGVDSKATDLLNKWKEWSGYTDVAFPYGYVSAGASESIKDIIALCRGTVWVFEGEYEGFIRYAQAVGCKTKIIPRGSIPPVSSPEDQFWCSDPSGIDGFHWIELNQWLGLMQHAFKGKVYLDLSYVGTVKHLLHRDLSYPVIAGIVFSLSKPFGVYRHRIGGCFLREPNGLLEGNKWFNNAFSLVLGTTLMTSFKVTELPRKYEGIQKSVVRELIRTGECPLGTEPSNVILLAKADKGTPMFRRAEGAYRFCLTSELAELIRITSL
jgi:hypothetical protein